MLPIESPVKVLSEPRLRSLAKRQGYSLRKSRKRKLYLNNLGEYMLVDATTNVAACGSKFDADLQEITEFLRA
jgi:hypothetical protein